MFKDRFSFYRSDEWRKLLAVIKDDRTDEKGNLICEHCGKPITRAYEAIGHHVIELTEENVNDYDISLNPQNIQIVCHKCHNIIHDKFGHSYREVYLVYGPPLSGKSTWVKNNMSAGDLVIDIDSIWEMISDMPRYTKPARLNGCVFKIRDTLLDMAKYRFGKWNSCYIIGGYPLQAERERILKEMQAREIFIEATEEECLERLSKADDGRDINEWSGYIRQWFETYMPPGAL